MIDNLEIDSFAFAIVCFLAYFRSLIYFILYLIILIIMSILIYLHGFRIINAIIYLNNITNYPTFPPITL